MGTGTYWEDPLKGGRKSPRPLVVTLVVGIRNSGNDDASNSPAHLQSRRTCASQGQRNDLTGISWRVGDEEAPWDTFECLSDDENLERVGLDVVSKLLIC